MQWCIGIDEAGRGALAGPVSVGAVLMQTDFDWSEIFALITRRGEPRLRDSKKLSAQQRDILFTAITSHTRLAHAVALVPAHTIDAIGIVNAAREAAAIAITQLPIGERHVKVLCDAGLAAPSQWEQESFVKGDERVPAIALASIIAKVTRDRHMEEVGEEYPRYGFEQHKGYGTLEHRKQIRSLGPLAGIHRVSFAY